MRKLIAATVIAAASFSLAACSDDEPTSSSPTISKAATEKSDESTESSESSTSGGASSAESEATPVSQTITDDVMGHTIKVTQLVRNFPVPDKNESLKETGEIVLVEVDITTGTQYSGGVQGGFKLKSADGQTNAHTTAFKDEVTAAGYTPFDGVSKGETAKTWLAFQVNKKSDSYSLVYKRSAAKVIGTDEVIPEQEWEVPLS